MIFPWKWDITYYIYSQVIFIPFFSRTHFVILVRRYCTDSTVDTTLALVSPFLEMPDPILRADDWFICLCIKSNCFWHCICTIVRFGHITAWLPLQSVLWENVCCPLPNQCSACSERADKHIWWVKLYLCYYGRMTHVWTPCLHGLLELKCILKKETQTSQVSFKVQKACPPSNDPLKGGWWVFMT
jgi:hypothetical protein